MSKVKKGNSSWKPASVLDVTDKEEGYRYRWSSKTPDNLAKKSAEGWETVSKLQSSPAGHDSLRIQDGKQMTTTLEKHDCILQRIPEEIALERDAYHKDRNDKQVSGLTSHIKKDLAKDGAEAHGDITISSRMGEQVIE